MQDNEFQIKNFVPVNRQVRKNWVYQRSDYFHAWFEMLACAKYTLETETKIHDGQIITMEYAEFIYGRQSWCDRLGIPEQVMRTFIKKLLSTNMIVLKKKHSKFSVYKITNFKKFNPQINHHETLETEVIEDNNNLQTNTQPTSNQPATNQQLTTYNKLKKLNKDNKDNKEYTSKVFDVNSIPYRLSLKLKELIFINNPESREPNLQTWAIEFDRMIRIDKRKPIKIYEIMEYSQKDLFWKSNILSAKALRDEYDRLKLQKDKPKPIVKIAQHENFQQRDNQYDDFFNNVPNKKAGENSV